MKLDKVQILYLLTTIPFCIIFYLNYDKWSLSMNAFIIIAYILTIILILLPSQLSISEMKGGKER